jgi:hypothetical protein
MSLKANALARNLVEPLSSSPSSGYNCHLLAGRLLRARRIRRKSGEKPEATEAYPRDDLASRMAHALRAGGLRAVLVDLLGELLGLSAPPVLR